MWDTGGLSSSLRLMATQLKQETIIIIIIHSREQNISIEEGNH